MPTWIHVCSQRFRVVEIAIDRKLANWDGKNKYKFVIEDKIGRDDWWKKSTRFVIEDKIGRDDNELKEKKYKI